MKYLPLDKQSIITETHKCHVLDKFRKKEILLDTYNYYVRY
jgi:hypothetical protein